MLDLSDEKMTLEEVLKKIRDLELKISELIIDNIGEIKLPHNLTIDNEIVIPIFEQMVYGERIFVPGICQINIEIKR